MNFYVYEWFNVDTNEIFYVGKGCKNRYLQLNHRNKLFQEYYNNNKCESRIIKYFNNEQNAFDFEKQRIFELKQINQAQCNIDEGGKGGYNFVWTDEMREYKSKYNPMKSPKQRNRMVTNNPMKNPNSIEKMAMKRRKPIVLGNIIYSSAKEIAKIFNVNTNTIYYWIKRGYSKDKLPCYYVETGYKEFTIQNRKTTNKSVIIDGIYYDSVKSGAKAINVWSETLIRAIKEKRKCKGHTCEYANQQPSQEKSDNSILEGSTTNR